MVDEGLEFCSLKIWLLVLRLWKYEEYINSGDISEGLVNDFIYTAKEILTKIFYWKEKAEGLK